jgi:AAA domain
MKKVSTTLIASPPTGMGRFSNGKQDQHTIAHTWQPGKPAVSTELRTRRIDATSLEGKPVPDREWLARDLIPAKNVTLLYGDGGTGKSLLALQLGVTSSQGKSTTSRCRLKSAPSSSQRGRAADYCQRRLLNR